MSRPLVVLALTPVAEQALEQHLFGQAAAVVASASVAEADEIEAEAIGANAEAVLLSPGLSGLTEAHCASIRARGVRIVGVALDEREQAALGRLGIDETITPDVSADELRTATRRQPTSSSRPQPPNASAAARGYGRPNGGGSLLVVVGSKGAPGASECACSLAALAVRRWTCLLVELDGLGGCLDLRLGADAHQGSLLGLVRAADSGEGALRELLERWLVHQPGWPPVLLAPPDRERTLPELAHPGAVSSALRALASVCPLAIVDVGFLLQDGQEGTPAALTHREALVTADSVLLVVGARESQLRAGFDQLDHLLTDLEIPPERLRIVLNGVGGPGSSDQRSLEHPLALRLAERGLALDARLPWDSRALQRATTRGLPLSTARPRSPYTRALGRLLEELFLPVAPAPRGRKQRLTPPLTAVVAEGEEVVLPWRN